MFRLKLLICLLVLFTSNFILVSKSEALLSNVTGWTYEQMGDFSSDEEEKIDCYKKARDYYQYDNNNEGYERTHRKICLIVGYKYEDKGDSSSDKNEKIQYYKEAIGAYEYGKCSLDKARVEEKLNNLKSWWQKLFD